MGTRLTHVPFDIETTGFAVDDAVTVVGFELPLGCRVLLNTGERPAAREDLAAELNEACETTIRVSVHPTETALLEAVATCLDEQVAPREYLLVAYNGERFTGGFDLPFLRTRYGRRDIAWPFDDIPYADLMPIVSDRFNTTVGDGDEASDANDLVGAYDRLVGGDLSALDPFEESSEAVEAFRDGEFRPLLAHNVADVRRTGALSSLAQRYCGTSEFDLKSLTPSIRDPSLSPPG